jgi:serine/threonine protein kinase
MSPQELAPILTQTCKALGRAHALGIVHRDVKPDNVFLVNMGDETFVKVLDFGIAKLGGDDTGDGFTVTGNTLGTPFYMSPEQLLSSKAVDFRSDLWSIGVVVYQALTGARPFRGETIGAVSVAVHGGAFAAPSRARTGLSPAIDAWVTKALQREPENRFGSAREMAAAFEAAMLSPNDTELDIGAMAELIEDDDVSDSARTIALSAPSESPASSKKEAAPPESKRPAPVSESKRPAPVSESKRVIVPVGG